jgi:DNA-binding NarL/FixJ family response regulator
MPVIVLSAMDNAVIQAYEAGATAFIPKTADVETLFEHIRILMHFWTKVVELPKP